MTDAGQRLAVGRQGQHVGWKAIVFALSANRMQKFSRSEIPKIQASPGTTRREDAVVAGNDHGGWVLVCERKFVDGFSGRDVPNINKAFPAGDKEFTVAGKNHAPGQARGPRVGPRRMSDAPFFDQRVRIAQDPVFLADGGKERLAVGRERLRPVPAILIALDFLFFFQVEEDGVTFIVGINANIESGEAACRRRRSKEVRNSCRVPPNRRRNCGAPCRSSGSRT